MKKKFNFLEDYKRHLEQFSSQKDKKFWEDELMKLHERWQKVVEQNIEIPFSTKLLVKMKNVSLMDYFETE